MFITKYVIEESLSIFVGSILKHENVFELEGEDPSSTSFSEYPSLLIFLNEYRKATKNDFLKNDIYKYTSKLVGNLNSKKKCNASLCYGLIGIGYSFLHASDLNEYETIFAQLNKLVIKITRETLSYIKSTISNQGLKESDYDLIQGLTSNLTYLIHIHKYESCIELIKDILTLLIKTLTINNTGKLNMLIETQNMINDELQGSYPEGFVNLSLSHGISSILMATATAYEKGFILPNHKKAIDDSLKLFMELAYIEKVKINNTTFFKAWWPWKNK